MGTKQNAELSAEASGVFKPTLNMMGWQQNHLDEYLEEFLQLTKNSSLPLLDIGAAYGFMTKLLLKNGTKVIANDLESAHLEELRTSLSAEEQKRVSCETGDFRQLFLEPESVGGILGARVLQFLPADQIRPAFSLFFKWMSPGGVLCITNASPYRGTTEKFIEDYERKKLEGVEWPGVTNTGSLDSNRQKRIAVQSGYRFDPNISRREAELAGFRVIRCSFYSTPFLPQEYRSADGKRDAVGLIAVKD